MLPRITQARYVSGYTVRLRFSDGSVGTVDLSDELVGPMFESLRDAAVSRKFSCILSCTPLCG